MAKSTQIKNKNDMIAETSSQRILLEEYRLLQSRFLSLRDEGVARMNFFVTSASVVLGGVLVFGSSTSTVPVSYFKFILLVALAILLVVGYEIYNFLVARDTATDRYERGLARIRQYFIHLDANLNDYFVTSTTDLPTRYVVKKDSGIRRSAQIIEGFLLGLALTISLTFTIFSFELDILIGLMTTILVYLILEIRARRKIDKAFVKAEQERRFGKDGNAICVSR